MRRMKRKNPKHKKRHNPPRRRRHRRNPEAAAAAKKPRKKTLSMSARLAQAQAAGTVSPEMLQALAMLQAAGLAPKPRAGKGQGKPKAEPKWKQLGFPSAAAAKEASKAATAARKAESAGIKAVKADIRRRIKAGEAVTAEERAAVARKPRKPRTLAARAKGDRGFKRKMPTKGRGFAAGRRVVQGRAIAAGKIPAGLLGPMVAFNKAGAPIQIRSARSYAASEMNKKGSSKASKKIASAWRSAQLAQRYAATPAERAQLRAMGLDSVPNPSTASILGDIKNLMPQIAGATGGFVAAAVLGQMATKAIPEAQKDAAWAKAVPSVASLAIGAAGYAALRMSKNKSISSAAPFVLAGGVVAAAVHAIVRVKVGDQSIAQKLGLPFLGEYSSMAGYGEYSSMAGFGEYSSMAGGTAYSGERGIFSGLDDTDPVLHGTDDEDEVDMVETAADEGVNADEGSLNGSIFD